MRPFAPCFGSTEVVSPVYLLTRDHCGRPIRRSRSVAHVLGKLQIECVYLLIAYITDH
jgi:hypothetical protein